MIELLKDAISSLEHSQVFISSRQKMHESGQELHQETIDKLKAELKRRKDIEDVKSQLEEHIEQKFSEAIDEDEIKCSGDSNGSFAEAIMKHKKEQE